MVKDYEKQLIEFCKTFGLGMVIKQPVEIKGGLLHKLYKVTTNKGEYAIKCLNSMIMKRESALKNMKNSEKISAILSLEVPAILAKEINGNHVHLFKEEYFMIFNWIDGKSMFPPDISEEHCYVIGDLLGKIHSLDISVLGVVVDAEVEQLFEWNKYHKMRTKENTIWFSVYEESLENLIKWNLKAVNAKAVLSKNKVISHRDLDPKNVMWQGSDPYLIDWEAAGYINPYQELLEVLNYWADDGNGGLVKKHFVALLNAYKEHKCMDEVNWDPVLDSGYEGMLGWLEYNLKRALGIELTSEDEICMGEQQVIITIRELYRYEEKIKLLKEWL